MTEVDAVVFDLDNTLFDRKTVLRRYWRAVLCRVGVGDAPAVIGSLVATDTGARGRLPVLLDLLRKSGVTDRAVHTEVTRSYTARVKTHLHPCDLTHSVVRQIAASHDTAVLTNGNPSRQRAKLAALGLADAFGVVVASGDIGAEKPEGAAFQLVLDMLGVAPHRALMVGDDPERDIAGADAAGMRTCWLRRDASAAPSPAADLIIDRLTDLPGALACSTPHR